MRNFRDYLADHRAAIAEAIKKGVSREEAEKSIKLEKYADFSDGRPATNTIRTIYDEIKAGN